MEQLRKFTSFLCRISQLLLPGFRVGHTEREVWRLGAEGGMTWVRAPCGLCVEVTIKLVESRAENPQLKQVNREYRDGVSEVVERVAVTVARDPRAGGTSTVGSRYQTILVKTEQTGKTELFVVIVCRLCRSMNNSSCSYAASVEQIISDDEL
jgi:hypothetical protein